VLLAQDAGTLIVTGVETFTPAQQKILQTLLGSREVFQPFARRFRVVLAAGGSLSDLADSGQFDETLYYKISAVTINVPPLRKLHADILPNVRQLLDQHATDTGAADAFSLTTAAAAWLEAQTWPGNYDQLRRLVLLACEHGAEIDEPVLSSLLAGDAAVAAH
jgi:DNA-binding NtrC family response regulator